MADPASTSASQATFRTWAAVGTYLVLLGIAWPALHLAPAPLAAWPVVMAGLRYGVRGGLGLAVAFTLLHQLLAARHGVPVGSGAWLWATDIGLMIAGLFVGRSRPSAVLPQVVVPSHLSAPLQRAGDGPWEWNLDSDEARYSDACQRVFGGLTEVEHGKPDAWLGRVHPDDLVQLRAAIDAHVLGKTDHLEHLHRIRRNDGAWRWVLARAVLARAEGGPRRLTGWLTDLTERGRSDDSTLHHAFHDALTGLPNAALFSDRLAHALARARRDPTRRFAVMYVDLDGFGAINTQRGHGAGDDLLLAIAHRLESSVRPGDTVARVGNDDFAVLLEDADASADALSAGERVRRALLTPLPVSGGENLRGACVGLVLGDGALIEPDELMRRAREAAREAQEQSLEHPVLFESKMHDKAVERAAMEQALRGALERGQMAVHYQPVVDLTRGVITGFEALARWRHPTLGLISPLNFIPLAEEAGIISEIGAWVLFESLGQAKKWQDLTSPENPLRINVNLSTQQLREDRELVQRVAQALEQSGLAPSVLTLEITESLVLEETGAGIGLLAELRERGVHVCMDDFGTGYSSLSYLHRARVDALKIDLSLVRNLTEDSEHAEIVRTILTLAKALGLRAIAEGVETEAQLQRLRELGCDAAQGFLFSPPVDAETAAVLLKSDLRW